MGCMGFIGLMGVRKCMCLDPLTVHKGKPREKVNMNMAVWGVMGLWE